MDINDVRRMEDPEAQLERAFEEEYIRSRGYDPGTLGALKPEERSRLLKEASSYASQRLAEVRARAHYVQELHDTHRE
jgi:hypothetical protein